MPINLNMVPSGEVIRADCLPEPIEIQAGKFSTIRYTERGVGRVLMAACHQEDKGGVLYVFTQDEFDSNFKPNITSEDLVDYVPEYIPPGATVTAVIEPDGSPEQMILLGHHSVN